MAEREVMVLCYWNGCIKYGPDGVYYEGSNRKKISVKQKTEFSRLVDGLYLITGLGNFKIFGKYPVAVSPNLFTFLHLPVVSDSSLEAMLEVPSNHPSINIVELYLEAKPTSDDVIINYASCSSPLENPGSSSKRQMTQQPQEANGYVDMDVTHLAVKLERDNGLEVQGVDNNNGEANADFGNSSTHGAMMDNNNREDFVSLETIAVLNAQSGVIDMNEENSQIVMNEQVTYSQGPEHSATQALRRKRRTSTVWEVFQDVGIEEDGKERVQCIHCGSKLVISSRHGTNHLKRHAERCPKMSRKRDRNSGLDGVAHAINLTADNANADNDLKMPGLKVAVNACLNKGDSSSASNSWSLSSLWVDDDELRVGLCFKDKDELKKAVDWCTIRGRQKCVVEEIEKDEYVFKCIRWKCNWSVHAARMEEHGLVEITKCIGPHTCCPTLISPDNFDVKFAAEEIECLIRVQPTLTIDELNNWWFEKYSCRLGSSEMKAAKQEVIKKIYGDWDQSFRVLPKLMAALHSSSGLVVDWQYDLFPNPEFASFRSVFWAFPQSIEGFPHCIPLIVVDTKDLKDKYPLKLMIASGVDAADHFFPLAFAVTIEVSSDSWRWFLSGIREKVTQREDLCLISGPDPHLLTVINESGSQWKEPWAYHRFCLNHLCSHFHDIFKDDYLKNLVEEAGLAMQQVEFDSVMETIKKKNPEARRWLDQLPSHQWTLAHDGGRRNGIETIDTEQLYSICESFQSLDLSLTATILLLFDEMRSFFLMGICDSKGRLKCGDVYTKPVMDKLEEFMSASVTNVIMPLDKGVFQVTDPLQKDQWIVQLSECTCTCGEFQLMKFPCLHALAVCEKLKINPLQYVDEYYTLERLYKTYAATFSPVPEISAWPEASGIPTLFPPVILPPPPPPTKVSSKS